MCDKSYVRTSVNSRCNQNQLKTIYKLMVSNKSSKMNLIHSLTVYTRFNIRQGHENLSTWQCASADRNLSTSKIEFMTFMGGQDILSYACMLSSPLSIMRIRLFERLAFACGSCRDVSLNGPNSQRFVIKNRNRKHGRIWRIQECAGGEM